MNTNNASVAGRWIKWLGWLGAPVALVGLAIAIAQPGCADNSCTPSDGDNTSPGPAFECSAREVCYLGVCRATCSAGGECTNDDDCGGARPNCVAGFCSSCQANETCVPTLNICQPVGEVERPSELDRPVDGPRSVPRPLDAGFTPGGVVRPERDAGNAEQPQNQPVTVAAVVDLGREFDYTLASPGERAITIVRAFDTASDTRAGLKWRADVLPPRIEEPFSPEELEPTTNPIDEFCEVRKLAQPQSAPAPTNLGEIRMVNPADFQGSIDPELTARYDVASSAYVVTPGPLPPEFLTFSVSVPTDPHFVFVSGSALPGVVERGWPETVDFGHHVPFELVPSAATRERLAAGYEVAEAADQDLIFRYDRIETGNDGFEAVFVRVEGARSEIFCEQREGPGLGGELRVRAAILDAFRDAEDLAQTATYELFFERASRERLQPASPEGELVLVTIRIRHSLKTSIVFR